MAKNDEALLKEIRDRYDYMVEQWRRPQEERREDLRYICGDPWTAEERKARKGRPTISHDELGQYVNAAVNSMRQNPRSIKVDPLGYGATEKSAELRQGLIREIERNSRAKSVYLTAYQNMVEGSYGYVRISRRYRKASFEQEIVLKTIPNPDSVLFDPDVKEADWSDAMDCFVLDPIPRDQFKRRWPKARITDFSTEHTKLASAWIQEKLVLTAEYWQLEPVGGYLYLLENGEVTDEDPGEGKYKQKRPNDAKKLIQRWTNGIEILEETEQPGDLIPIAPFVGLQRYIDEGSGAERKIFSLVRIARDPQKTLAYLCSQEMEEAGLSPKVPYVGYKGQFESDAKAWKNIHRVPHPYVQVDPMIDAATNQVLPLPQRQQFTPNFQSYEVAKDSARRAVQAAVGTSPLPTAAQRQNEKSGIALERIQEQQEVGSFHFVDGFDRGIAYVGRVIEGWIPATYDSEREVAISQPDESRKLVKLNTEEPYTDPQTKQLEHFVITDDGEHQVTISDGPSVESQREAAAEFLDLLVQNLQSLPVPAAVQARLLALAIRMKQLGPKGDEMADLISPNSQQALPPAAQAQLDQAHGMIQQLTQALNQMSQKLEAKLPELAMRERVALINAKAGIIEAALKAKSEEALAIFQADIEQIDRMLQLMPDPGMETGAAATQMSGAQASPQPSAPAAPQPLPQAA